MILPERPPKETFGSLIGKGLGDFLRQKNEQRMQKEALRAQEESKSRLLEQEYGLKSGLEERKRFSEQLQNQKQIEFLEKQYGLEKGTLEGFASNPEFAAKILQPKTPPGGLSGQAVPQDVSNAIQSVISSNPEANADQLALEMDKEGIPRTYSNSYIENRRRQEETTAKTKAKGEETARKEQLEFHKESAKFDEKLSNEASAAEKKIRAISKQREIQPTITNFDRIISSTFKNTRFENLLKSKNAQEFDSLALPMVEGQKETFGVRLSDADLNLILQKIATADKNPQANAAILDYMELEEKLKLEKRKIADQIKKQNKGLRPLDYESSIRQKLNEKFGQEIDETASRVLSLPDNERKREMITGRKTVPQGTPLSRDVIDKYLELAGNDPKKAQEMALEDGYEF